MEKSFYTVKDIQRISGYSESKSYNIIKQLNIKLEERFKNQNKPIFILKGRIPIWFFEEMTGMKEVKNYEKEN